jgi:hypothetical protein
MHLHSNVREAEAIIKSSPGANLTSTVRTLLA